MKNTNEDEIHAIKECIAAVIVARYKWKRRKKTKKKIKEYRRRKDKTAKNIPTQCITRLTASLVRNTLIGLYRDRAAMEEAKKPANNTACVHIGWFKLVVRHGGASSDIFRHTTKRTIGHNQLEWSKPYVFYWRNFFVCLV